MDDDILKGIRRIRPQAEIGLEEGPIGGALPGVFKGRVEAPYYPKTADSEMMRAYKGLVDMVPIPWLQRLPGNTLRNPLDELKASLGSEGVRSPLILNVGKDSRTAQLGEGNHRLAALREMGYTHAPARTIVGSEWGRKHGYDVDEDLIPRAGEYFSSDARPSDVFRSLRELFRR